jgi:hypothetical protein
MNDSFALEMGEYEGGGCGEHFPGQDDCFRSGGGEER